MECISPQRETEKQNGKFIESRNERKVNQRTDTIEYNCHFELSANDGIRDTIAEFRLGRFE